MKATKLIPSLRALTPQYRAFTSTPVLPKTNPKTKPKSNPKTTPKSNPKTTPKSGPKTTPNITPHPSGDLWHATTFPTFQDIPTEWEHPDAMPNGSTYYTTTDGTTYSHRRHWCYLGEIKTMVVLGRLRLWVQDIYSNAGLTAPITVPVHFHTPDCGVAQAEKCKEGDTIAILYPVAHHFLDMSTGFKVTSEEEYRIMPYSLEDLAVANDKIFASQRQKVFEAKDGHKWQEGSLNVWKWFAEKNWDVCKPGKPLQFDERFRFAKR